MLAGMKEIARRLRRELEVYQLILKDSRTPRLARILLGLAVGYTLLPFHLIPEFIPIIGYLDDVIIEPALINLALRMIPDEVVQDCRDRVQQTHGGEK